MKYISLLQDFINTTLILSPEQKISLRKEILQSFADNYIKEHIYLSIANITTDFMRNVMQISKFKEKNSAELKRRLKYSFAYIIKKMAREKLIVKRGRKCYKVIN